MVGELANLEGTFGGEIDEPLRTVDVVEGREYGNAGLIDIHVEEPRITTRTEDPKGSFPCYEHTTAIADILEGLHAGKAVGRRKRRGGGGIG